jgi:hypothetical protein
MSRFADWFVRSNLNRMGWPATKGIFKTTSYLDAQKYDDVMVALLQICVCLGAGRPETALALITEGDRQATENLDDLIATLQQRIPSYSDPIWDYLWSNDVRWVPLPTGLTFVVPTAEELFEITEAVWGELWMPDKVAARDLACRAAALWGITHAEEVASMFSRSVRPRESAADLVSRVTRMSGKEPSAEILRQANEIEDREIRLAAPRPRASGPQEFYVECDNWIQAFERDEPRLLPPPSDLRNHPVIAIALGISPNESAEPDSLKSTVYDELGNPVDTSHHQPKSVPNSDPLWHRTNELKDFSIYFLTTVIDDYQMIETKGLVTRTLYIESSDLNRAMWVLLQTCVCLGAERPNIALGILTQALNHHFDGYANWEDSPQKIESMLTAANEVYEQGHLLPIWITLWSQVSLEDKMREIPYEYLNSPEVVSVRQLKVIQALLWGLTNRDLVEPMYTTFQSHGEWTSDPYDSFIDECDRFITQYEQEHKPLVISSKLQALPLLHAALEEDERENKGKADDEINQENDPPYEIGMWVFDGKNAEKTDLDLDDVEYEDWDIPEDEEAEEEDDDEDELHTPIPTSSEGPDTTTVCLSCNHTNPSTNKFCGNCGTALPTSCLSCKATIPPQNQFCGQCGARKPI